MTLRRFAFIPVVVLVVASIAIALAGPARADVGGRPISVVMTGTAMAKMIHRRNRAEMNTHMRSSSRTRSAQRESVATF